MCGIIGILNNKEAKTKIKTALAMLKNRGQDASNSLEINKNSFFGHTLHAVVNHVEQPLQGDGTLITNCEIYNWKELSEKYDLNAKNDAEFLLKFLDKYSLEKLDELDGVYAFAYHNKNKIYLVRDIIGVKPLCFSYTTDDFMFSSEGKVLEKIGCIDIQELNPRKIMVYDLINKKLSFETRPFFKIEPEHKQDYNFIKKELNNRLNKAIKKRLPNQKVALLFSGGIDSTYIAHYLKENDIEFTCYTTVLDTDTAIPEDLVYAKKIAKELNLNHKIRRIKIEEIPNYLKKIVPLIEDSNVTKVGVALTFYLACEMAKKDGCKVIFSGLGSEEIFAGYERHKQSGSINQECISGLIKMYERDLYRDDVLCMDNKLELRLPFLDKELVDFSLKIPTEFKIKNSFGKHIFREIALENGIKKEYSFRKKKAAQYGSRIDNSLGRLAKRNGFRYKSEYLRSFYPTHNLKLGVLFSSGKDSTSAAHIMYKQNYELTCLITLKPDNPDSYMFQTAGTELVELQAEAMELPIIIQDTKGIKEEELEDLEKAIIKAKEGYKIEGVVSGALFSTYQRNRIEKICDKLGLKIFSPLWHKPQEKHMQEVINNGFEAILTKIAADGLNKTWLGKRIDEKMINDLKKLHEKNKINIAFEGGEAETLVLDGPIFKKKIQLIKTRKVMNSNNEGVLIVDEAILVER